MKRSSIFAASLALALLGSAAPAWADIPPGDPECDGKKEGDACTKSGASGVCKFDGQDLFCEKEAEEEESGCAVGMARGGRAPVIAALALAAASAALLRRRARR